MPSLRSMSFSRLLILFLVYRTHYQLGLKVAVRFMDSYQQCRVSHRGRILRRLGTKQEYKYSIASQGDLDAGDLSTV